MSKITRRQTLTRGGQAVAAAAVLPVIPSIANVQEDAELFVPYEEWRRLEQIAISKGDDDAPWRAAFDAEDRFVASPVLTLAGLLFKLRYACLQSCSELEWIEDGYSAAGPVIRAVLRDLETMVGNTEVPHPAGHIGRPI